MRRIIYTLVFFCLASVTAAETSVTITSPDLDVYSYQSNRKSAWDALASFTITSGKQETIVKINGNGFTGPDGKIVYNADLFCPDNTKGEGRACFRISSLEKKEEQKLFSEYVLTLTSQKRTQLEYFCRTMANNYENLLDAIIEKSEVASNFEQPYLRGNLVDLFKNEQTKFELAGSICLENIQLVEVDETDAKLAKSRDQIQILKQRQAQLSEENASLQEEIEQKQNELSNIEVQLKEKTSKDRQSNDNLPIISDLKEQVSDIEQDLKAAKAELQKSKSGLSMLQASLSEAEEKIAQKDAKIKLLVDDIERLVVEKANISEQLDSALGDTTVIIENEKDDNATSTNSNRTQTGSTQNAYSEAPDQYRSTFYILKVNRNLEEVTFDAESTFTLNNQVNIFLGQVAYCTAVYRLGNYLAESKEHTVPDSWKQYNLEQVRNLELLISQLIVFYENHKDVKINIDEVINDQAQKIRKLLVLAITSDWKSEHLESTGNCDDYGRYARFVIPLANDNQFLLSTYQNLKNSNKILEFKSDTKLMAFIKKDAFHLDYISNGEMLDDNLKRVQIKSFMQLKLAEKQKQESERKAAEQKEKSEVQAVKKQEEIQKKPRKLFVLSQALGEFSEWIEIKDPETIFKGYGSDKKIALTGASMFCESYISLPEALDPRFLEFFNGSLDISFEELASFEKIWRDNFPKLVKKFPEEMIFMNSRLNSSEWIEIVSNNILDIMIEEREDNFQGMALVHLMQFSLDHCNYAISQLGDTSSLTLDNQSTNVAAFDATQLSEIEQMALCKAGYQMMVAVLEPDLSIMPSAQKYVTIFNIYTENLTKILRKQSASKFKDILEIEENNLLDFKTALEEDISNKDKNYSNFDKAMEKSLKSCSQVIANSKKQSGASNNFDTSNTRSEPSSIKYDVRIKCKLFNTNLPISECLQSKGGMKSSIEIVDNNRKKVITFNDLFQPAYSELRAQGKLSVAKPFSIKIQNLSADTVLSINIKENGKEIYYDEQPQFGWINVSF